VSKVYAVPDIFYDFCVKHLATYCLNLSHFWSGLWHLLSWAWRALLLVNLTACI